MALKTEIPNYPLDCIIFTDSHFAAHTLSPIRDIVPGTHQSTPDLVVVIQKVTHVIIAHEPLMKLNNAAVVRSTMVTVCPA